MVKLHVCGISVIVGLCLASSIVLAEVDVICLMQNCADVSIKCATNPNCVRAIQCLSNCAVDQKCTIGCLDSYGNDLFSQFTTCAIINHKCVVIGGPSPFKCTKPSDVVSHFKLSELQGKWYKLGGTNPIYDCYDCSSMTFTPNEENDNENGYTVQIQYLATTAGGDVRQRNHQGQVTLADPENPALISVSGTFDGIPLTNEWRLLHIDDKSTFALVYYCGASVPNVYGYEGTFLMARQLALPKYDQDVVRQVTKFHGYNATSFCSTRTKDCPP